MSLFSRQFRIRPNHEGFLFKENVLIEAPLLAGVYEYVDFWNKLRLVEIPQTIRFIHVTNQEVLTKDNIALRFSFVVQYRIEDGVKHLSSFNWFDAATTGLLEGENLIRTQSQVYLREKIAGIESTNLNEKREELAKGAVQEIREKLKPFGLAIAEISIIDFTFPKLIQDLFSKELEAKIRAKSDLENARTTVATARMLKNAADLIKQNEEMKFVQTLEMIAKVAEKGKHTFHIGEILPLSQPRKNHP